MALNLLHFLRAELPGVRDIEACVIRRHQRASLLNVVTQDFPQGTMHQVSGRMVNDDGLASVFIYLGRNFLALLEQSFSQPPNMPVKCATELDGVFNLELCFAGMDYTGIAHLTTGFRVKRCLIQNNNG